MNELDSIVDLASEIIAAEDGRILSLRSFWRRVGSIAWNFVVGSLLGSSFGDIGALVGAILLVGVDTYNQISKNECTVLFSCESYKADCTTGKCVEK